jgi:putative ABC transport system permease protein
MELHRNFRENFELAIDTVRVHKLRSFLAVLGVMIGVMLIILVVGLVEGFRTTIQDMIEAQGVNTAWAWRFNQGPSNGRRPKEERLRKPLTLEDGEAVAQLCPAVKAMTIAIYNWEKPHNVRYQNNEVQGGEFRGTFANYPEVDSSETMKRGRFFTETENSHREDVVVIGEDVAKALFPTLDDAPGKEAWWTAPASQSLACLKNRSAALAPMTRIAASSCPITPSPNFFLPASKCSWEFWRITGNWIPLWTRRAKCCAAAEMCPTISRTISQSRPTPMQFASSTTLSAA